MKNKPKVFVHYGPSSKLFDIPNQDDYITLTKYVMLTELPLLRTHNDYAVTLPSTKLVAFPEEYFGVTENFIHSFWSRIDSNPLEEVYLLNPPVQIIKQAKAHALKITERHYAYGKLDKTGIINIRDALKKKIHGQESAISRTVTGLIPLTNKEFFKPIIFMFYGPAGVGKTETAKILAQQTGGEAFRTQFSMMQTSSLSEYLYGGKTSDKSLSSDLLERETNILIFDEFDKTTEHFHSAFYQLFDEGIFKDKNYEVEIKNAVIICTSNYDSLNQIKQHLGNALYSRISSFVQFGQLSIAAKKEIAKTKIEDYLPTVSNEFAAVLPSKDEIYQNCEAVILESQNAREIEQVVGYYISNLIYNQIFQ